MRNYIAYFLDDSISFSCPDEWDSEDVLNAGCHAVAKYAVSDKELLEHLFMEIDNNAYDFEEFMSESQTYQEEELGELLYENKSIVTVEED